jgi:hypothetical protein
MGILSARGQKVARRRVLQELAKGYRILPWVFDLDLKPQMLWLALGVISRVETWNLLHTNVCRNTYWAGWVFDCKVRGGRERRVSLTGELPFLIYSALADYDLVTLP